MKGINVWLKRKKNSKHQWKKKRKMCERDKKNRDR